MILINKLETCGDVDFVFLSIEIVIKSHSASHDTRPARTRWLQTNNLQFNS